MPERRPGRKALRWLLGGTLTLAVLLTVAGGALWLLAREAMGGAVEGTR